MWYEIKFNPLKNNKPYISIEEDTLYWHLIELNSCDVDHIMNDVLPSLAKVMSGELAEYEFGYDSTIVHFVKGTSVVNYEFFEKSFDVSTAEIFKMMQDWNECLITWKTKINQ